MIRLFNQDCMLAMALMPDKAYELAEKLGIPVYYSVGELVEGIG